MCLVWLYNIINIVECRAKEYSDSSIEMSLNENIYWNEKCDM